MSTCTIQYSHEALVRDAKRALVALAMFIGVVSVAHCGSGCRPAQAPTDLERNYTTEIVACAATAGYPGVYDHAADMRCRAVVDCKYKLGPCL